MKPDPDTSNEPVVNKIGRFVKYNKLFLLFLLILGVFISYSIFGSKGLIDRFNMQSEKKELEHKLMEEVRKTNELQKEIDELKHSEEKIEKVARERYGLTKDGEEIYRIKIDTIDTDK